MAKVIVTRTPEQKLKAKERFGASIGRRVERSRYLEGQAVPRHSKTPVVTELRDRASRSE